jgi:transposase-like protein
LFERGIDLSYETVRYWWNRFGPMFAAEIRRKRSSQMRQVTQWRWHLDEVYVKINGELHYLWRAVDHEGEVLESFVTKTRDKAAALKFIKKAMKRYGSPKVIVTDRLRSYGAAMKEIGNAQRQETGRRACNRRRANRFGVLGRPHLAGPQAGRRSHAVHRRFNQRKTCRQSGCGRSFVAAARSLSGERSTRLAGGRPKGRVA